MTYQQRGEKVMSLNPLNPPDLGDDRACPANTRDRMMKRRDFSLLALAAAIFPFGGSKKPEEAEVSRWAIQLHPPVKTIYIAVGKGQGCETLQEAFDCVPRDLVAANLRYTFVLMDDQLHGPAEMHGTITGPDNYVHMRGTGPIPRYSWRDA